METKSKFYLGKELRTSKDEQGNPANGTRLFIDEKHDNEEIIMRFNNGYLDGDSYTKEGELIVQPAVECEGHLEYWRKGQLHRDNKLPAVSTNGFSENEYWEHGERIK